MRAKRTAQMLLAVSALCGCAVLRPLPPPLDLHQRLAMLPTEGLPLRHPVTIRWHHYQIPFIEAETDADAAFALGLVHAHLRLAQIALMRHIAYGRLAELAGPLAADIDHGLRILDLPRAAPEMVRRLPEADRLWLEAFVAGLNHMQEHLQRRGRLPHEFAVLGLPVRPWRPADVLAIGRLASVDVNWLIWFRLLHLRERPDWPQLWARLVEAGTASLPSFARLESGDEARLAALLLGLSRSGSNSLAVGGARSRSGAALIASDPHLGLMLPNTWIVAGYRSPSYQVLGLMIPGLPFVAVGRNPWIGWGGANMRAASSDLFDASNLPDSQIRVRRERIKVRWWPDREVTLRETPLGPVISDAPMVTHAPGETLALRWMGHEPTGEFSAMLRVNQARTFEAFHRALEGFAVSGQNMIYADKEGHVGQVLAVRLPKRRDGTPRDMVLPPESAAAWTTVATAADLPWIHDPPAGFVTSANNRPADAEIPVGYFFSSNDRIARLSERIAGAREVGVGELKTLQRDVRMPSALALRDLYLDLAEDMEGLPGAAPS